jgi:hypothetical protein
MGIPIPGKPWDKIRGLTTTKGEFDSFYLPGDQGERVLVYVESEGRFHEFRTPGLHDWRLAARDGKIDVRYNKIAGDGHELVVLRTNIECGEVAGGTATGPAPTNGGGMTQEQFDELKAMVDQMHTDVVGRLKAHDEATKDGADLAVAAVHNMPERILLFPNVEDHWGLDERARFATLIQEILAVMLTNQAFLQVFLERLFEAAENLRKEGVDLLGERPATFQRREFPELFRMPESETDSQPDPEPEESPEPEAEEKPKRRRKAS